jgi:hypothetical protein
VAGKLRFGLVVELGHFLPAEADVDDQEGLSLVHQTDHHYLVLLNIWELEGFFRRLNVIGQDFEFRDTSLASCRPDVQDHLIFYLDFKPLSSSQPSIDTDSRVEGNIKLSNACYVVRNISDLIGFGCPVERVIIIFLSFSAFIEEAFQWIFSIC